MKITLQLISLSLIYAVVVQPLFFLCGAAYKPDLISDFSYDMPLIVTMGDSYSSGEGNEPFYGQELGDGSKQDNQDWLAHRSEKAWGGLLEYEGVKYKNVRNDRWFFVASSGATAQDICKKQPKTTSDGTNKVKKYVDPQIDVFSKYKLYGKVDYVTITLGGNDVGFEDIIIKAAMASFGIIDIDGLEYRLDESLSVFYLSTQFDLMNVYSLIHEAAGKQAKILVVGYPPLIDDSRSTKFFGQAEALMINAKIVDFNDGIIGVVKTYSEEINSNIDFIPIYNRFETHEAYTSTPYINGVKFTQSEDINKSSIPPVSAYSIHPNGAGQEEIANIVQEYINGDFSGTSYANTSIQTESTEETTTETTETTVAALNMEVVNTAYREVLADYEVRMRMVENADSYWIDDPIKSCALTDLTGDGVPELIILYWSDEEYGVDWSSSSYYGAEYCYSDLRIFTVLPGETSATEMLHIPQVGGFQTWGRKFPDVILLSNGNLLVSFEEGDSWWMWSYFEYALSGSPFQQVNEIKKFCDDLYDPYVYTINGMEVSESDFSAQLDAYIGMFSNNLLSVFPSEGYDDWTNALLSTPNSALSFDEAWIMTASAPVLSQDQAKQALENYWNEYYELEWPEYDPEDPEVFGWYNTFEYVEDESNDYTCVYVHEFYEGANCYYYTYYFMDLTTGMVHTMEFEELGAAVEGGPGMYYICATADVFNGLDYIN